MLELLFTMLPSAARMVAQALMKAVKSSETLQDDVAVKAFLESALAELNKKV